MSCAASNVTSREFLKITDKCRSLWKALDTVRVMSKQALLCSANDRLIAGLGCGGFVGTREWGGCTCLGDQ